VSRVPLVCRPSPFAAVRLRSLALRVAVVAMVATVAALPGCAVGGILGEAFAPKIKAKHKLASVPTLIMVEDRSLLLEDPDLTSFIASAIAADLRRQKALRGATIIKPSAVAKLRGEFDRAFETMAIDEVGQRVGASQVLYVNIRQVQLMRAPGLYQPAAMAEVKVIDAVARKRVFPPRESAEGIATGPRGFAVVAELPPDAADTGDRAYEAALRQRLSRTLANEAAKLFYAHKPRQPGDRLPG
jgi:hypothetical protein